MAKDKKITIGAINITMQPHSPDLYIQLFKMASRLRRPVKVYGDQHALLAGAGKLDTDQAKDGPITGDIYKFTDIDLESDWFNIETNDFASLADMKDVSLPENLKPNSSRFSYIFYPDNHILVYEGYYDNKTLTPSNAVRFFENILNQEILREKFGKIEVTHEPETNALDEALGMKQLDRIKLTIKRPNADHLANAEREFLSRLQEINVEEQEITYKSAGSPGIEVDDKLDTLARIASRNGEVYAKGRNGDDKPVEFSTKKHPLIESEYYDPDLETPFSVFSRIAAAMKREIVRRLN